MLSVLLLIVIFVLWHKGFFRKKGECRHCGKKLKGTEQTVIGAGENEFILCSDCASKIHKQILDAAGDEEWTYQDYLDCLAWYDETAEERARFKPDASYEGGTAWAGENTLEIDTENLLFRVGTKKQPREVFRFADIVNYKLEFVPEKVDTSFLGNQVNGKEFIRFELIQPRVTIERTLKVATYDLKKKGIFNPDYKYKLPEEFNNIIIRFLLCVMFCAALRQAAQNGGARQEESRAAETDKALALFMFDSIADVTEESLKRQRDVLIKAFHPDNGEENTAYAQKINAAYVILKGIAKKNAGA